MSRSRARKRCCGWGRASRRLVVRKFVRRVKADRGIYRPLTIAPPQATTCRQFRKLLSLSLLLAWNDASQTFVPMRRPASAFQKQPVPQDLGRVLFAGFEAGRTASLRQVGRSSRGPEALVGGDIVGEVERALAERKPHQVVVIETG